jgi:hypothetical protein
MAIVNVTTIKNWFRTGLKPTQAQFWDTWDSFRHKNDKVPVTDIEGIDGILNSKADKTVVNNHLTDENAHASLFQTKEDKTQKGAPNGYAPLDEFTKLATQYLNIVNDLVTGGSTALLSAEQGKILQTQISAINTLLTSDNVNLDTVQELVDAIETVQLSLSTILVNDLSTGGTTKALTAEMGKLLQTNKVDKVAGERLINAAEITKLAGLSNVVTTVKTILSTALATQDIAGFVTYINTLAVPLVVGANEIVEYKTSDTGRVFKLLLRGRSFGVGQPAITAADVIEQTEFLNKDIRLSNYPSTRNDGQLPTNKVLAPDVNGNLKLFTIATAPAPYLENLIPNSHLPSTTGNFILKGSFFTPTMTISIAGQTVNWIQFISDNEVHLSVTTGAAEGYFSVTLNNGISSTFQNALLIVLGTVYIPTNANWTDVVEPITIDNNKCMVKVADATGSAKLNYVLEKAKPWQFYFSFDKSPITPSATGFMSSVYLTERVTGTIWRFQSVYSSNYMQTRVWRNGVTQGNFGYSMINPYLVKLHFDGTQLFVYTNNVLSRTFTTADFQQDIDVKIEINNFDITQIKKVELA